MVAAVVMLVGGLLIGVGSATKSWVSAEEKDFSVKAGLFTYELCSSFEEGEHHCESGTALKEFGHAHGRAMVVLLGGTGAFLAGLATAIMGILAGILLLTGKRPGALGLLTAIGAGLALVFAIVHIIAFDKPSELHWGYGMPLFFLGAIGALVGALIAPRKVVAPVGVSVPPCATCRNPLQFVPQYQRWFCAVCNRYM
jgi:hypothetical protein